MAGVGTSGVEPVGSPNTNVMRYDTKGNNRQLQCK